MDADRFDILARSLTIPSRRRFSKVLAGLGLAGGLGSLLGHGGAEAKKKKRKKKKKCKGGTKKCGKKCIASTACCPACGNGETCQNGVCQALCDVCPSGCEFSFLPDAIADAAPGDTITICNGTYTADIVIEKDLTLIGEGAGNTILQGKGTTDPVVITGAAVTLQALRIIGGVGGIQNFGTLELIGCTITDNGTSSSGGGIYNEGTVTLTDCEVSENEGDGGGGGIFNASGTVTLTNSEVSENRGSSGGGIFNSGGTVTVDLPSRITDNHATSGDNGGGIHTTGGTVTLTSAQNVTDNFPNNCRPEGSVLLCVG